MEDGHHADSAADPLLPGPALPCAGSAHLEPARLVAEQEARVAQLDRDGRDTTRAEQLRATFRETQAQHIEHRDLVRGEMSE